MERFKALEKEMKTKAFSKEGLIQAAKLDPAEKAKMETINWLSSMIDELARQVEASEAEVEVLAASSGKKRGKGPGGERIVELETLNERRKWHVGRMELIQRMVDNGSISVETVDSTKEDISYFVESNQVRLRFRAALSHNLRASLTQVRFALQSLRRRTSKRTRASTTSWICRRTMTCSTPTTRTTSSRRTIRSRLRTVRLLAWLPKR